MSKERCCYHEPDAECLCECHKPIKAAPFVYSEKDLTFSNLNDWLLAQICCVFAVPANLL
jgi:hypothetical protein